MILILVLLGMYFDAAVVFVTSQTILFKLAPAILWFWILISFRYMYLVRDITQGLLNEISTLIYQTTNLVFPNFFHEIFSVEQLKNKTKNFSWVQNRFFSPFWTYEKFVLNWEDFVEQIGENKIPGLVVQCHELIIFIWLRSVW